MFPVLVGPITKGLNAYYKLAHLAVENHSILISEIQNCSAQVYRSLFGCGQNNTCESFEVYGSKKVVEEALDRREAIGGAYGQEEGEWNPRGSGSPDFAKLLTKRNTTFHN